MATFVVLASPTKSKSFIMAARPWAFKWLAGNSRVRAVCVPFTTNSHSKFCLLIRMKRGLLLPMDQLRAVVNGET